MISVKAKREWLDAIEKHFEEYSWPLFGSQFLIYEHRSEIRLGKDTKISIFFEVDVGNKLKYPYKGSFYFQSGNSLVRLSVPFWWKWLLQRRVMKLMNASLKEELKRLRGQL